MLCKYKNIFGEPNTGVHSIRVFNIAIVDLLLTILMALLISHVVNTSFIITLVVLIVLSIIIHKIFCVETTFTNFF